MLYDKNRRPILEFDILKVFHFTGARKKKYYMYKQALAVTYHGKDLTPFLNIAHLQKGSGSYIEKDDGRVLGDYEIVQGFPDYEEREKLK